jgi:oxygen-independent coproporphyrinogen-3 oxidase
VTLAERLARTPYDGYAYAYPHKTAYRPLDPPVPLSAAWADERRDSLFLYLHVPFCEMRCGFCNLFTLAHGEADSVAAYLAALERQGRAVGDALDGPRFARLAIGGGTPTYLDARALDRLFDFVADAFGVTPADVPSSCETSPATATAERLAVLAARGVSRLSLGVQTFDEAEALRLGRPQVRRDVESALARIRAAGFPTLNVDLIYGIAGQDAASLRDSLDGALAAAPEEIYLYPLYVRPLTGLERRAAFPEDASRRALYRVARAHLLERGYEQATMRLFRRGGAPASDGPAYCCQRDGMVGLGAGARSYTRGLHYSSEWAVSRAGVKQIVDDYVARPGASFALAHHGFRLTDDEQRRRHVIQSLLSGEGLDGPLYAERFGARPWDDLPELAELTEDGLAVRAGDRLTLTPQGLELSDAIGPWLYSAEVRARSGAYAVR